MLRLTWEAPVQADAEAVFAYLSDFRTEPEWNPRALHVEKLTDGPIGAGTRFRGQYRIAGELTTELTAYESGRAVRFRTTGKQLQVDGRLEVTPTGAASRAGFDLEMELHGLGKFVAPLLRPLMQRQNRQFAARVERGLAARRQRGSAASG